MRKLSLLFLLCAANMLQAQNFLKEKDLPPEVLQDFRHRFPYVENVIWVKQSEDIIGVSFNDHDAASKAIYLVNGEWQQSEKEVQFRDLPDSAAKFLKINYGALTLHKVTRLTTRRYGVLYDVEAIDKIKKLLLTFDMNGGLIESKEEVLDPQPTAEEKEKKGGLMQVLKPKGS